MPCATPSCPSSAISDPWPRLDDRSFIVETIFAIPGLGRHFVTSIYNRDYTVILGITIFYSFLIMMMNLLVDLIYPLLDPRITVDSRKEE